MILDYQRLLFHERGMPYSTHQKHVLAEVITNSERPLTPIEIRGSAKKEIPKLGIATVYRALKQFVEEGQVRVVEIPGAAPHYESAARQHHHFFFCNRCRRIFNLIGCVRGVLGLAPAGFQVKRHEIVLYGDCADCRTRT
jgi:Fur family ferric uptake transcriptional regulator